MIEAVVVTMTMIAVSCCSVLPACRLFGSEPCCNCGDCDEDDKQVDGDAEYERSRDEKDNGVGNVHYSLPTPQPEKIDQ